MILRSTFKILVLKSQVLKYIFKIDLRKEGRLLKVFKMKKKHLFIFISGRIPARECLLTTLFPWLELSSLNRSSLCFYKSLCLVFTGSIIAEEGKLNVLLSILTKRLGIMNSQCPWQSCMLYFAVRSPPPLPTLRNLIFWLNVGHMSAW